MAGYVIIGALAAFGALCLLWTLLGWLLTQDGGCAVVCAGTPVAEVFVRYRWLRSLGLLKCPLIAVTAQACPGGEAWEEIERCSPEDLLPRLLEERNRFDGTGTGDPTGRSERRGVSEL